jgi:hypothetical protein
MEDFHEDFRIAGWDRQDMTNYSIAIGYSIPDRIAVIHESAKARPHIDSTHSTLEES